MVNGEFQTTRNTQTHPNIAQSTCEKMCAHVYVRVVPVCWCCVLLCEMLLHTILLCADAGAVCLTKSGVSLRDRFGVNVAMQ